MRGKPAALTAYVDASHGCHRNGTSRTGIVITLDGGVVIFWYQRHSDMCQNIVFASNIPCNIYVVSFFYLFLHVNLNSSVLLYLCPIGTPWVATLVSELVVALELV
jgi:hypothetical protein